MNSANFAARWDFNCFGQGRDTGVIAESSRRHYDKLGCKSLRDTG